MQAYTPHFTHYPHSPIGDVAPASSASPGLHPSLLYLTPPVRDRCGSSRTGTLVLCKQVWGTGSVGEGMGQLVYECLVSIGEQKYQ